MLTNKHKGRISHLLVYVIVVLRKKKRRINVLRQRRPGVRQKRGRWRSQSFKVSKKKAWENFFFCHHLINTRSNLWCRSLVGARPANLQHPGGEVTAVCWAHRPDAELPRACGTPPPVGAARLRQWNSSTGDLAAHRRSQRRWTAPSCCVDVSTVKLDLLQA